MIGRIKGKIVKKELGYVVVDVSGVGYKIFIMNLFAESFDKEVILYTHLYVREDTLSLYGFLQEDELELFELLISISGIGPKAALGVLGVGNVNTIKKSIAEGRSDLLMGVSGVGRKMAERVVLELKNKVISDGSVVLPQRLTTKDEEILEALMGLGYKKSEAMEAVSKTSPDLKTEERVKEALRFLS